MHYERGNIMQVNQINSNPTPNFKSAYIVKKVVLDGVSIGSKKIPGEKEGVYTVAMALAKGMYRNSLPDAIQPLIKKFFPQYSPGASTTVARTQGPEYLKKIVILSDAHADEYRDIFKANVPKDEKREIGAYTLDNIVSRTKCKNIIITAETKNNQITITNIEKYVKEDKK